jgi:hypothetical protein
MKHAAWGAGWLLIAAALDARPAAAAEPSACASSDSTGECAPDADSGSRRGFSAKLFVGPAYRRVYRISILAADIGLAAGAQTSSGGWYGTVHTLIGSTRYGLHTFELSTGFSWEWAIDRLHLGLNPQTSYIQFSRTTNEQLMQDAGFGIFGFATVDVIRTKPLALILGVRGGGNCYMFGQDTWVYGITGAAGVRY